MSNIEKDLVEIEETKSELVANYKDLIVGYEEVIEDLEGNPGEIIVVKCSKIYFKNDFFSTAKLQLIAENGKVIYQTSGYYAPGKSAIINLLETGISDNSLFTVKAVIRLAKDVTSSVTLEYSSVEDITAKLRLTEDGVKAKLVYLGTN